MDKKVFASSWAKLDRADEHIKAYKSAMDSIMNEKFYDVRVEDEPGTLNRLLKAYKNKEIPLSNSTILGDAFFQIRSSLDHLAVGLALLNKAESTKSVYFPFAKSKEEFERPFIQKKIKKLSSKHKKMICNLQPYQGGNDLLWSINAACNADKHNLLLAIIPFQKGISGGEAKVTKWGDADDKGTGIELFNPKDWSNAENGILLAKIPPNVRLEMNLELKVEIVFGEIELLKGNPVYTNLKKMSNLVRQILEKFEREI